MRVKPRAGAARKISWFGRLLTIRKSGTGRRRSRHCPANA